MVTSGERVVSLGRGAPMNGGAPSSRRRGGKTRPRARAPKCRRGHTERRLTGLAAIQQGRSGRGIAARAGRAGQGSTNEGKGSWGGRPRAGREKAQGRLGAGDSRQSRAGIAPSCAARENFDSGPGRPCRARGNGRVQGSAGSGRRGRGCVSAPCFSSSEGARRALRRAGASLGAVSAAGIPRQVGGVGR
jgi:hypothetical protein